MKQTSLLMRPELTALTRAGIKTQTRRISGLKEINKDPNKWEYLGPSEIPPWHVFRDIEVATFNQSEEEQATWKQSVLCPYGRPGDLIYLKEPHFLYGDWILEGLMRKTKKAKWRFRRLTFLIRFFDDRPGQCKIDEIMDPVDRKEGWHKRSALFMAKREARTWVKITGLTVDRLQDIKVDDIVTEGVTIELFESMLNPIAKKLKVDEPHWICHHEMGECGTFCFKCGEKRRKELFGKANEEQKHNLEFLDGGWTTEFDSPPRCDTCDMSLHYFPTGYCFDEEMHHFLKEGVRPNPLDSYGILALTGATNLPEQKNRQKFLKIGWRFLFNLINGPDSWDLNPWVWVITYKLIDKPSKAE